MAEVEDTDLESPSCRFCVSWYTLNVAYVGVGLLISSWNEHRIPGKLSREIYYIQCCMQKALLVNLQTLLWDFLITNDNEVSTYAVRCLLLAVYS